MWLERRLSKQDILIQYLNSAYFGAGATGISAAARVHFDKPVTELTLEESALLAGLITAPSRLNPLRNPEAAQARAGVVLNAMADGEKLDRQKAQAAVENPAKLRTPPASGSAAWFADWVYREAAEIARSFDSRRIPAIRVRTTLDPRLQAVAEETISAALDNPQKSNGATQAALVAMRFDGSVVAMVGGRSYEESEFNRAVQAMRQPGSAFKLFVYYAALRNGFSLDEIIEDEPLEIEGWKPENFGGRYYGRVSLADAFARSLNAATVGLAQSVGIAEIVEAARFLGIDAPLSATPSLALGTSEVSLIDLTGAYASVRAGMVPIEATGIAGFAGLDQQRLLAPGPPSKPRQSLAPHQSSLMKLLRRVVDDGTGRAAALDGFAAGKTGTSENYRDAWFVGFTDHLVAGVWVGNDNGEPMNEITGGKLPALIWKEFMSKASHMGEDSFLAPDAEAERDGRLARDSERQVNEHGLAIFGSGMQEGAEQEIASRARNLDSSASHVGEATDEQPLADGETWCDVDACSRAYHSFRESDCTYQPYRGRRELCPLGSAENPVLGAGDSGPDEETLRQQSPADEDFESPKTAAGAEIGCNIEACSRFYSSFRASDCTYQPYRGSRRVCER